SAPQSPLNSRRSNNLAPLLFATCPSKTVSVKQMLPTNFSYGTALDDPGPQDCGTQGPGHDDRHANRKLTELPLWIQMRLNPFGGVEWAVMLNNLSEQIRECLQYAEDCGRQAAAQTDQKLKQDFLDKERRWLMLAQRQDFTQRLS